MCALRGRGLADLRRVETILAGGAGADQRERGQRTVLRDLGLLDDREKRFRARRRLCWIGQRDPGSILSRLPAHVLDEVVPYFDPAPRAAV